MTPVCEQLLDKALVSVFSLMNDLDLYTLHCHRDKSVLS